MKASGPAQLSRHSQAAPAKMAQWFEEALGLLPSSTECDKLTRRFQLIINRADNSEKLRDAHQKGRRLSPVDGDFKDASLDDFLGKRLESVHQAGKELLFRLAELEKFAGNYHWKGHPRPSVLKTFGTYSCKSECWLAPIRKPRPSRLAVNRQKPGIK
jgi:hypothetical protein